MKTSIGAPGSGDDPARHAMARAEEAQAAVPVAPITGTDQRQRLSGRQGLSLMTRNLSTSLKRRSRVRPFDLFDHLPPELRAWLAGAALPWSPRSILRLWPRLLREESGSITAALARLDLAEQRMLARDCPKIWGECYPSPAMPPRAPASSRRVAGSRTRG